jgi:hypothetical protein
VETLDASTLSLMVSVGHRSGLFDAMAAMPVRRRSSSNQSGDPRLFGPIEPIPRAFPRWLLRSPPRFGGYGCNGRVAPRISVLGLRHRGKAN